MVERNPRFVVYQLHVDVGWWVWELMLSICRDWVYIVDGERGRVVGFFRCGWPNFLCMLPGSSSPILFHQPIVNLLCCTNGALSLDKNYLFFSLSFNKICFFNKILWYLSQCSRFLSVSNDVIWGFLLAYLTLSQLFACSSVMTTGFWSQNER